MSADTEKTLVRPEMGEIGRLTRQRVTSAYKYLVELVQGDRPPPAD